jgi:hypothetical protein
LKFTLRADQNLQAARGKKGHRRDIRMLKKSCAGYLPLLAVSYGTDLILRHDTASRGDTAPRRSVRHFGGALPAVPFAAGFVVSEGAAVVETAIAGADADSEVTAAAAAAATAAAAAAVGVVEPLRLRSFLSDVL